MLEATGAAEVGAVDLPMGWRIAQAGVAMRFEAVTLPDLGTGPGAPIVVSHWFARPGEAVWEGERLVEVVVGPSSFDVPSPATGQLAEVRCREDDPAWPGSILGIVAVDDPAVDP